MEVDTLYVDDFVRPHRCAPLTKPLFNIVKWCNWLARSHSEKNIGSNPVLTTMSKRYSESLNQDFTNDSAECLRREWDIVG